tara:strand:- start:4886 stop:5179 length:294 start_codon:yes stop_codon:yes gene_type:complete
MGFLKNKYFFWGIIAGLLWTCFGVLILLFIFSDATIEYSLSSLHRQNKLGGLISIAALINLPIFFIALRKKKFSFASGLVALSVILVMFIAFLKINT